MRNEADNLTLLTDLYELTMMQGYMHGKSNPTVVFDMFYRTNPCDGAFAICAGLEQVIEYIENLRFEEKDIAYLRSLHLFDEEFLSYLAGFRFSGDIYAIPEGTVIFPREPMVKVVAPIMEAQLVETAILTIMNHQSLIATKAARVCHAARGDGVMEFGLRRAQGPDAGIYGARAAVIGGCVGTSNVLTGQMFHVPVLGTHAHSWIMSFPDEYTAFKTYARLYPDACILLVDTYDVLDSGIPNAIKVFREMRDAGIRSRNFGIRIDSGDLAYLTKKSRAMLDDAGFPDAKIVISNSLDEYTITSILHQGGEVSSFGVGERLITSRSEPVFGAVYKLCAVEENGEWQPRIKLSETVEKITNPGLKDVYRVYSAHGEAIADLITLAGEEVDFSQPYQFVDPEKPWKKRKFENCTVRKLQKPVILVGKRCAPPVPTMDIAAYVKRQMREEVWEEEQRFENPHRHYLDFSPAYYQMKMQMLGDAKE